MEDKLIIKRSDGDFSTIYFGNYREYCASLLEGKRVIIVTDENVYRYYSEFIDNYEHIIIGLGEENKNLSTAASIYAKLLEIGADRKSFVLGFGGGIVTDITGFIASTFMRGMEFGFIASTLLAQVDASVGGKNGVNFEGYKNMVGVFNQPSFVICDSKLFDTLPEREFRAGLSEIIKAGLISDIALFEQFEKNSFEQIFSDRALISSLIRRSVEIKAEIVELDEREGSVRKKLNLGHTYAHAVEKLSREFLHGEAVSIGLAIIGEISVREGRMSGEELGRVETVLAKVGLPTSCDIDRALLNEALKRDKKKDNNSISFIMFNSLGSVDIVKKEIV